MPRVSRCRLDGPWHASQANFCSWIPRCTLSANDSVYTLWQVRHSSSSFTYSAPSMVGRWNANLRVGSLAKHVVRLRPSGLQGRLRTTRVPAAIAARRNRQGEHPQQNESGNDGSFARRRLHAGQKSVLRPTVSKEASKELGCQYCATSRGNPIPSASGTLPPSRVRGSRAGCAVIRALSASTHIFVRPVQ